MKNMIKLPAVILGLMLLVSGIPQKAMAQDDDISLETFYDELSPYGTWTEDPQYGYVWRPDVDQRNFRPYYTDGHWAMTEYGNTWVSDYEWGWAPFHYGRWLLNQFNDWIWIPDTVWGPAWVSWRSGEGYYGWAPLSPGFDIDVNIGNGGYNIPNDWWVFIPQINIYNNSYPRYYNRNNNFFNRTRIINYNYGRNRHNFYTGPRADDIRRATRRDVTVYNIAHSNRPGRSSISNNNLNIYTPGRGGRRNSSSVGQPGRTNTPDRNNNPGNVRPGQPDRNTAGRTGRNEVRQPQQSDGQGRQNQARQPREGQQQDQQRQMQQQQRDGQVRQQRQQQEQQQRQQQDQQQRDGQARQQRQQQEQQQRQQQDQQRQQQEQQQRDGQARQQRQQQEQQQDQQRQQQEQQQRDGQARQQRQQQEQQQRQQQDQQRQQQEQQQRQQQDQQRQQQQQRQQDQSRPARTGRGN